MFFSFYSVTFVRTMCVQTAVVNSQNIHKTIASGWVEGGRLNMMTKRDGVFFPFKNVALTNMETDDSSSDRVGIGPPTAPRV